MRVALLVLTLAVVSLVGSLDAWAAFNCFETPGEGRRCACVGTGNCSEMKNSDSCKSEPECDKSELGAIICSCKAVQTSRTGL
jgi:hypothetical protein